MSTLIVQMGHCYRTHGATGTQGEQSFAARVGEACTQLLTGGTGWSVRTTLADEDRYRGDAFVAVHCDGSDNPAARGASVGYRTPEGQAFAQAWKRAYAARGWPIFRPDNYTAALAGYYGVREAVAAGNRRAMIIECGFLTSPADRLILNGPGGAERVALAIGDALGIPHGRDDSDKQDEPEESMHIVAMRGDKANDVYLVKLDTEHFDSTGSRLEFPPGHVGDTGTASHPHTAVRTYIPPDYGAAVLGALPVKVVPQAALDAIPKTEGSR